MIRWICDERQSLKQFTDNHCAQASFCFFTLLREKEIKINGKKTGENVTIEKGDDVCYYLTKKQAEKRAYALVYEDENFLVVDKESGVNSEAVFAELSKNTGGRCAFIHRLDRNTAGLLCFSKNEKTERALLAAFKEKRVEKRYHALCFGCFSKNNDSLTAYLKKDGEHALVKIYDTPVKDGEKITTEYRVIERRADTTKAEVILHTGKTHQIRAHLAYVGCPIVGDMKYGNSEKNKEKNIARQQLVAKYLSFSLEGDLSYVNGKTFVSQFEV